MIDVSKSLFVLFCEVCDMPLIEIDEKLPKDVKVIGLMPDDLKDVYSGIVRIAAERVALAERIETTSKDLPPDDENPVRMLRTLLSAASEEYFDKLLKMKRHADRLAALHNPLIAIFYAELKYRFPNVEITSVGVAHDWQIFNRS